MQDSVYLNKYSICKNKQWFVLQQVQNYIPSILCYHCWKLQFQKVQMVAYHLIYCLCNCSCKSLFLLDAYTFCVHF
ncbi:hypothetical protein GDO86_001707 [Hymenochirus boettgeri]|uniref:Uncharacterized protein n=1 Tax=Hymenochirus boettgeri TaxID=247094 RepID=A0A8T2KJN7_9PIPI|nr:hypothetical protein GDO86_001707 [Hymenochirus boettgeri]